MKYNNHYYWLNYLGIIHMDVGVNPTWINDKIDNKLLLLTEILYYIVFVILYHRVITIRISMLYIGLILWLRTTTNQRNRDSVAQ